MSLSRSRGRMPRRQNGFGLTPRTPMALLDLGGLPSSDTRALKASSGLFVFALRPPRAAEEQQMRLPGNRSSGSGSTGLPPGTRPRRARRSANRRGRVEAMLRFSEPNVAEGDQPAFADLLRVKAEVFQPPRRPLLLADSARTLSRCSGGIRVESLRGPDPASGSTGAADRPPPRCRHRPAAAEGTGGFRDRTALPEHDQNATPQSHSGFAHSNSRTERDRAVPGHESAFRRTATPYPNGG